MTDFTITITDENKLSGITAARTAYNAVLSEEIDDPNNPGTMIPNPAILNSDNDYVQFVMDMASQSYANQYKV
jgi:hypothetical protein